MQIIQAANPIKTEITGQLGLHYFYILKNDAGQVIGQLNGLQFKDGVPSTTGIGGKIVFTTEYNVEINSDTIQRVVAIGDKALIQDKMWAAAIQCGVEVNKANYDYMAFDTFGGHNSNAVFSTLAACMQLDIFKFDGFAPGLNDFLIAPQILKMIRAQNGYGSGGGGGDSTGGSVGGSGNSGGDIQLPTNPGGGKIGGGYWQNPQRATPDLVNDYVFSMNSDNQNDRTLAAHESNTNTDAANNISVITVGIAEHASLV